MAANKPTQQNTQAAQKQANSTKKIVIIVLVILLSLGVLSALGGYLIYRSVKNAAEDAGIEQVDDVVKELEQYPEAYIEAGLPQYPGANITNLSGNDATVEDSITIIISTGDSQPQVTQYFNQQLTNKGWKAAPGQASLQDSVAFRTYSKGGQQFSLSTQQDENSQTTATIFWGEEDG